MKTQLKENHQLLTLSMIVKDEVSTITRTLLTAKPFIDRWIILDTGSTDGTQDVIRRALEGVPGEMFEEPFVDFSTSRNRALDLAGTVTPFVMWLDADDELMNGPVLRAFLEQVHPLQSADHEAYFLRVDMGIRFDSPRVVRTTAGWRFEGVVHEILVHPNRPPPVHRVPNVFIRHQASYDSCERSRKRWEHDVILLSEAVRRDPGNTRSAFYLAQTYLWLERYDLASLAYKRRITLGGWAEEVYESKMSLARIATALHAPWAEIQQLYLDAHSFAPHRAEPLYAIALHYNGTGEHALTFIFARRGYEIPLPTKDTLFVDEEVYSWKMADLVGTSAYWIQEFAVGELAARQAVTCRPNDARLMKNLEFYLKRAR